MAMQFNLVPHPAMPPSEPFEVWASVDYAGSLGTVATANMWFGIRAPASRFNIPAADEPKRTPDLWETTCFEAFLRDQAEQQYREWNFAPSGDWAAYDLSSYRDGMADAEIERPPYIRMEDNLTWWGVGATITVPAEIKWALGLSAILEEKDGTKSYWALAHPEGEKPDFHDPVCFAAHLP
jgi:hypothetical protein